MMHARPRHGFTLVELLIGLTMTVGIISSAYLCLRAGSDARKVVEHRIDALQKGRVALNLIARDLRCATTLTRETPFVGLDRRIGIYEADNLDFASHAYTPSAPGEGDLCEVSYFLDRNPRTGVLGLWRRRDTSPDEEPLEGGTLEEIVPGISGLRFEYLDGLTWYDEWGDDDLGEEFDPEAALKPVALVPEAVRITIAIPEDPKNAPRLDRGDRAERDTRSDDAAPPADDYDTDTLDIDFDDTARSFFDDDTDSEAPRPLVLQLVVSLQLRERAITGGVSTGMTNFGQGTTIEDFSGGGNNR